MAATIMTPKVPKSRVELDLGAEEAGELDLDSAFIRNRWQRFYGRRFLRTFRANDNTGEKQAKSDHGEEEDEALQLEQPLTKQIGMV